MTAPTRTEWQAQLAGLRAVPWMSSEGNIQVTGHWRHDGDQIRISARPEHASWGYPGPIARYRSRGRIVAEQWQRLGAREWRWLRSHHPDHPKLPQLRRLLCRIYGPAVVELAERPAQEPAHA